MDAAPGRPIRGAAGRARGRGGAGPRGAASGSWPSTAAASRSAPTRSPSAAARAAGASLYVVRQPPQLRWHLPSREFDPAVSAALRAFVDHVEVAVAVHGYGRAGRWTTLMAGGTQPNARGTRRRCDRGAPARLRGGARPRRDPGRAARAEPGEPGQPPARRRRAARAPAARPRQRSVLERTTRAGPRAGSPRTPRRSIDALAEVASGWPEPAERRLPAAAVHDVGQRATGPSPPRGPAGPVPGGRGRRCRPPATRPGTPRARSTSRLVLEQPEEAGARARPRPRRGARARAPCRRRRTSTAPARRPRPPPARSPPCRPRRSGRTYASGEQTATTQHRRVEQARPPERRPPLGRGASGPSTRPRPRACRARRRRSPGCCRPTAPAGPRSSSSSTSRRVDRLVGERPHHAPPHHQVPEAHARSHSEIGAARRARARPPWVDGGAARDRRPTDRPWSGNGSRGGR